MYSGVADPASPASTSAASPGASCSSAKFRQTITKIVGIACSRRLAANSRLWRFTRQPPSPAWSCAPMSLRHPGPLEGRVKAQRAHYEILQAFGVHGHEVQLEHEYQRACIDHPFLELMIERAALGRIELHGRLIHQLVGFRRAPARAVDEHRTWLDRVGVVEPVHAD